jgi:glycosyltransferase involved in cell wall biosynthesis
MTDRPLRVLQVIDSLWPGGAERLMPVLVGGLAASGEATSIVRVAGAGERSDPALERAVREPAADFAYLGVQRLYDPRFVRKIGQVARRHGVDVIHSHLNLSNVTSRVAAAALGLPHVATIHLPPDEHSEDAGRRVWADGLTARLSTRIVGVSPDTAQGYGERFGVPASRLRVIPNGTAPRPASPGFDPARLRAELLGDPDARFVLCAARLEERKGVADLVAAAAILRRTVPDAHVVIAGKGPEEERLAGLAREAGAEAVVHLVGFRDDMGDLLAAADAYCLPSYIEGLPVSVLEAMWAGTPCVATRVGGTTFVVRDGETGLLAPPRDPAALAAALARVLTEPGLAETLVTRALAMVRAEFTPEKMSADYAQLYREVVAGGRRG